MGSSSSKPTMYPFPMPRNEMPLSSKLGNWGLSTKKKNKKSKESGKLDDFIVPKYPAPAVPYGFPYYQMPSAFPTYYAPVQMAYVQPFGIQQPVLAMPQTYVPMVTAAPVQPAVAPAFATQSTPAMQMPVPGPTLAPAPTPTTAPVPQSVVSSMPTPPISSAPAPPAHAPTQIPQPHPPLSYGPVFPPSPIPAEPVIPPPPIVLSEPSRPGPDSGRIRFTDFYRPADSDFPPPHRLSPVSPVRPPPASQPGRTPFSGAIPMPAPSSTPAPMPMSMPSPTTAPAPGPTVMPGSNNPLPQPPMDIWDTSPYRQVLANLPGELPHPLDHMQNRDDVYVGAPDLFAEPDFAMGPPSRLGGLFGSRDKGKKPLRGLFRSRSNAGEGDVGAGPSSRNRHGRSQTMTTLVIPPVTGAAGPSAGLGLGGGGGVGLDMPVPTAGPPVKFDHTGEYAGFVNHSPHRVMYKNKMYPTALHLLEAMKFTHQPGLQERIRTCKDVNDMYPLSASFQEHVRPDWGQVFLKTMEDVLYLKFKQHPVLRTLLLRTGLADIIYSDENTYWGDGPLGDGVNELGKALVRLRERLRQEGDD